MANTTILANYLVIADVDIAKPIPKRGLTVFCLDTNKRYYCYDNANWVELTDLDYQTKPSSDQETHALLRALVDQVSLLTELIKGSLS